MKIAVLGAGFCGLATAYHLKKQGFEVTVFEQDIRPGGLAIGYKENGWEYSLEKHYHHFFTNDSELISLAKDLGISDRLFFPKSKTATLHKEQIFPFNTPRDILNFAPLSFSNRLRLGLGTVICKILPESMGLWLEKYTTYEFAKTLFGKQVFLTIWQPLLDKKFGSFANRVNAGWLRARIKKRTLTLGYIKGGFQAYADNFAQKCRDLNIILNFHTTIQKVTRSSENWLVYSMNQKKPLVFDAVVSTLPTPVFLKIITGLPRDYQNQLQSIPHLHALNLVLETNEPILKDTYWLNINDTAFPFLCLVQHTNFIDKSHYGKSHLLYVGNYLPEKHPYFQKTAKELFNIYLPYLRKIDPELSIKYQVLSIKQFVGYNAQPVFLQNYSKIRPFGPTPLKNLYFANLDSVYPWDRGTNYALEMGRKMAEEIHRKLISNYK